MARHEEERTFNYQEMVDVLVCDHCGAEAVLVRGREDPAKDWLSVGARSRASADEKLFCTLCVPWVLAKLGEPG